mmetsp:Transcript_74549/g.124325  ORF Transcript_74549/g.124325 Transcript_74549/m.124325 type:complete len:225 (+) Transcript_74549:39-713(+)
MQESSSGEESSAMTTFVDDNVDEAFKSAYPYDGTTLGDADLLGKFENQPFDGLSDDPFTFEDNKGGVKWIYIAIAIAVLAICLLSRHALSRVCSALMRSQRRKHRHTTSGLELASDPGLIVVLGRALRGGRVIKTHIEVDGATHVVPVNVDEMDSESELPILITDACQMSGAPELARLDIVDLCLKKEASVEFTDSTGSLKAFDHMTTLEDLYAAFAIRVRIPS